MNTVSVVIPTYNRINVISRAIDSVLKQTHPINQIIVVDNNSTDNTSEILKNKYSNILIKVFSWILGDDVIIQVNLKKFCF